MYPLEWRTLSTACQVAHRTPRSSDSVSSSWTSSVSLLLLNNSIPHPRSSSWKMDRTTRHGAGPFRNILMERCQVSVHDIEVSFGAFYGSLVRSFALSIINPARTCPNHPSCCIITMFHHHRLGE